MAIPRSIYDTTTLLLVMRQLEPVQSFWLDNFFPNVVTFETEDIDFSQITETRKMAPLVVPTAQGKPIYSQAEKVTKFRPAYVKAKDAVSPHTLIRRRAGLGELLLPTGLAPINRYRSVVGEISRQHRDAVMRRWEWLAAEATLNGSVTLAGDDYPTTVVNFGRDAGQTVVKGVGTRWGDAGVSIVGDIETWSGIMRNAKFGSPPRQIIVGSDVWPVMRADSEIKELLRTDLRQTSGTAFNFGPRDGLQIEYMGNISQNLGVWVYSDYYENTAGTQVPFMDPKDVLLIGDIGGYKCYGAILDLAAQLQSLPIFPKMWDDQDPSATQYMTQSAPLMVPTKPNGSFKATVLA